MTVDCTCESVVVCGGIDGRFTITGSARYFLCSSLVIATFLSS